ncbi:probable glycosyltransferase At5g03795 [Quercus suber]|uniref:Glycosyltransferase n=1 Tax=Quercus suber TaxID=58331 RepID=A0AAW0KKL8_QUESU|nr:probable glycosyltransferase At5g03795 [Quercus suber]POE70045.1 putative glycosyltransferase [Quercus suber]
MGSVGDKKWCGCACNLWSSSSAAAAASSASVKLLLFMVSLIVVCGFVSVLGPLESNWVFLSSSSSSSTGAVAVTSMKNIHVNDKKEAISDDSLLSRSSTPPQTIEAIKLVQLNGTKEGIYNFSVAGPGIFPPMNESYDPVESPDPLLKARRDHSNLDTLEAGLSRARAAIREAKHANQTQDPGFVPLGPMYRNANVFYRSYLEMEKQFKIYVYEEGEQPLFHNGPCKSIYSTEGNLIHGIEINNQFRTRDPEKAHVFFLPFSVAMLVRFVYVQNSHDFGPIKHTVIDYVNIISGKYPYWNRSLGADHFMLSCHDWGPEASRATPYLHKNSIRVLCNANTSEGFNPTKDVSFPEINLQTGSIDGFIGGPSPSHRPILAFFAGGLHGPIRPVLLEHWENKDEDIQVHKYLPKGVSYLDMMKKSKYCICPSGYEVASPRIVEAIYAGCVPVLISDYYVLPFSDVLNWKSFSVEVPVKDVPNLKKILMSIPTRQYIRMQRRVVQVRRHFEVHSPPKRFDVFHMVLHSVWLRRLNVRVRNNVHVL